MSTVKIVKTTNAHEYVVRRVCARLSKGLERPLMDAEESKIRRLILPLRLPKDIPRAIITISDELLAKYRDERTDVHEQLLQEVTRDGSQEHTVALPESPEEPVKFTCDVTLVDELVPLRRAYLVLRGSELPQNDILSTYRVRWNIVTLGSTGERLSYPATNIVRMRMYPLSIYTSPGLTGDPTYVYDHPDIRYDRLSFYIEELEQQSVVMASGVKYHWLFKGAPRYLFPADSGFTTIWDYFPVGDDTDIIDFARPVRELTTITLVARRPEERYDIAYFGTDPVSDPSYCTLDFHFELWYQ